MKSHAPLKSPHEQQRFLLRRAVAHNKNDSKLKQNQRQLKLVRAMSAGRVRGGHSFH